MAVKKVTKLLGGNNFYHYLCCVFNKERNKRQSKGRSLVGATYSYSHRKDSDLPLLFQILIKKTYKTTLSMKQQGKTRKQAATAIAVTTSRCRLRSVYHLSPHYRVGE